MNTFQEELLEPKTWKKYSSIYFFEKCKQVCLERLSDKILDTRINLFTVRQCVLKKDPFMLSSSGAYFLENLDDLKGIINICIDIPAYRRRFFKDNPIYRQESFLQSLGIEINKYSIFLIILLHELGHSNVIKKFSDLGHINDYILLQQNIHRFCEKNKYDSLDIDNNQVEQKLGCMSMEYYVNVIESRADIFATEHFYPIWKEVVDIL